MSTTARNRLVLGSALAVALGTVSFWLFSPGFFIGSADLDIEAHTTVIGPLSPGMAVPLNLALTNPHRFNLVVADLNVEIRQVESPNAGADRPCTARDFIVSQISPTEALIVPARESPTLSTLGLPQGSWPRVGMRDTESNQDGCKGARITLEYSGTGSADLP